MSNANDAKAKREALAKAWADRWYHWPAAYNTREDDDAATTGRGGPLDRAAVVAEPMSRRWWKNERSRLAASVRATRRRLRLAYRKAAADARASERERYLFALAEERRGINKTQERLARLMRQVGMIRVTQERDVCSRDLIVRVSIADALLMRDDSKSLTFQLAEHIARGVQREIEALDLEAARAAARSRFVWPKPTKVQS